MPPDDDDPFAYLYRPEGQQAGGGQQPQAPRQPRQPSSYHQVRPVGERTFAGQQQRPQGYQPPPQQQPQQPQPDAYYAAPEAQPGAPGGGPGRRRMPPPEPARRNGLLIGAIAVVLAVVVGVGAAILFSGDGSDSTAGDDPTGSSTQDAGGSDGQNPDESPSDGESSPADGELPAAELAALESAGGLGGGAVLDSAIEGARSSNGSYITGLNTPGATVTWTFDLEGESAQYRLYTTYAVVSDDQTLGFSVNGEPRDDVVDLQDYDPATDEWENSWFNTWNLIDLQQGENTIQLTCAESCDAVIDQIFLSDHELPDDDPRF
jgi:hypothetical protein